MISQETIIQVKAASNIVEVVQDYIKLKREGANMVGLCPFHNEKTGSFTVSAAKKMYKCFGCGKSGDVIQFLMDHERKTLPEAIHLLAKKYNIEVVETGRKKDFIKPLPRLEKIDKEKLDWFETRKISNDTLLRLKITEGTEFMPQLKQESPVICFNYFRGEELVNIKFRGKKKSFKLSKDGELIFYNLNALEGEKEGIIVEGEIDTATLIECGIYNVVGVPNGTPPVGSKMNLEYLDNCWEEFNKLESVIIAVDDDTVGRNLKEELGRRIGKEKCKVVVYPEGCKDPNEILCKLGKQAVQEFIQSAREWPLEGIIPMDDMYEDIISYYENGYPPGDAAGVEGFDNHLTFFPGHLTMVTGIPGHGKDEFTNLLIAKLTQNNQDHWAIFNFEEPAQIHSTKLMEKITGKAFAFRKNTESRMSARERDMSIAVIDEYMHFVNVSKIDVTMEGILKKAIELVQRYGVRKMIINPWNYLEHKRNAGQSETEYISEMLTLLCNFLWQYGVHCLLIAHPFKMQKDKKTGEYEVPTLYSINGSSHFYNKAHNGLCVYKAKDGTTEIHVQKVKWYWLGKTGMIRFHFNTETRQYSVMEPDLIPPAELGAGNWKSVPIVQQTSFYEPTTTINEKSNEPVDETEDLPF